MKVNNHHTTAEDIERMKEYQLNRHRKLRENENERKTNLNKAMKLMDFPNFLNAISPYMNEVNTNAEEEE